MNVVNLECPKCRGRMEQGFVLDSGHADAPRVSKWVEGEPEPSLWTGLKLKNKRQLPISTYRCASCGYLEHYAK